MKSKKKRKLNLKRVGILFLILIIIGVSTYLAWSLPIRGIDISGNNYLKDNYIINYLDVSDKSLLKISSKKVKQKLLDLDLISSVKVRKSIFGKLKITIVEDNVLFYNWNNKKLVLSSGKEVNYDDEFLGVPTLINYVPDDIYKELVEKLNKVDRATLALVSEIEYSRSMINDKVIDDKRFLFRMNDGNQVYINTINIEKFNDYLEIYDVIANKEGYQKGCLYLDSNSENNHFNNCEEQKVVMPEEGSNE